MIESIGFKKLLFVDKRVHLPFFPLETEVRNVLYTVQSENCAPFHSSLSPGLESRYYLAPYHSDLVLRNISLL